MRTLILSSLALFVAAPGLVAQGNQEALKEKFAAKQKEAWFTGGEWELDFAAAKERAEKENKLIFAYFSRSYSP